MQPSSYQTPTVQQHTPSVATKLSKQFLKDLYESKCSLTNNTNPTLQILAFEQSLHEPHSQIIIRLSDGLVFVDCSLIGPYCIKNNKIVSIDSSQAHIEFNPRDLVKLTDYFSKIDLRKICELRIMIIRMELAGRMALRIGYPAELCQYFENMKDGRDGKQYKNSVNHSTNNSTPQITNNQGTTPNPKQDQLIPHTPRNNQTNTVSNKQLIKIEDDLVEVPKQTKTTKIEIENTRTNSNDNNVQNNTQSVVTSSSNPNNRKLDKQEPLTYQEIIQGKQGYFLGRLLRMKMANKQTKQGPMSVLYLGFIDRVGQLVRINMAGRLAMKQQRELKKGKCYYIKDLEVYRNQKLIHPQLRLKDKQYKIIEAPQPSITEKYAKSYYHWEHQNQSPEIDNVDIIGIIDDISDKKVYSNNKEGGDKDSKQREKDKERDKRQVVRITVRNKFKSVQINFWAEQIKALSLLKLKKKQAVVLEDIKKKKNIFLDYQHESSVIKLDQIPSLKQQLKHLLPSSVQSSNQPKNIHELSQIYQSQQNPTKTRIFRVYLIKMQQNRIIYKLCSYCRRKVQRVSEICTECNGGQFYYKYNCHLEFGDYSGTICCVAFQFSAQRLLGKNAGEVNQMTELELKNMIEQHMFKQYEVGIENRECRFIVRNVEPVESTKQMTKIAKENLDCIYKILEERKKKGVEW